MKGPSNDQWFHCVYNQGMNLHANQKSILHSTPKSEKGLVYKPYKGAKKGIHYQYFPPFAVDPTLLHAKSTCTLIYAREERKEAPRQKSGYLSVHLFSTEEEATKGRKPKAHSILWLSIILSSVRIKLFICSKANYNGCFGKVGRSSVLTFR